MDHRQAQTTRAAERYLLGEMSEPERFDFESHYFECEECAGDVRAEHALARGIKAIGPGTPAAKVVDIADRRPGIRRFTPAIAAGFALVAGYEGYLLSANRWQTAADAPTVLLAAARGEEQTIEIRRDRPVSLLSLDVNNADPGTPLTYEMTGPGGAEKITDTTKAPPAGSPLIVILSSHAIRQSGAWTLVLRTQQGAEIARYPFSVQLK